MTLRTLPSLVLLLATGACTVAGRGALAAPESYAAEAGAELLRDGGTAMDAAVCMGFVLAVTHPEAGNLGGGGFLVVHTGAGDVVIDARETAPAAAHRTMYLDENGEPVPQASLVGPRAAGVPGSVAGYLLLLERHGTMERARLLEPAIRLAETGFFVDRGLHDSLRRHEAHLARFPETAAIFLPGGAVPRPGDLLRQPALARVLRAIAAKGREGFYGGWFARTLEEGTGGALTAADLAGYEARVREPLRGRYRGCDVLTMPPPSSGGVVLLQMLSMLELGRYADMRPAQRLHLFAEVGRRAFADRALYFGDPDFTEVPVDRLLEPSYLQRRFATITMAQATPSREIGGGLLPPESGETCHFSVVDREGNAVACTTTLNGAYGCGLAVAGVLLNNEMDDFTVKPGEPNQFGLLQGEGNAIERGKRPLSSMTPTILLRDGRPVLVLGSPGGPTIISTVCQVIANHLALGMDLEEAVAAPRIHCQWMPDELLYERLDPASLRALEALGHTLRKKELPMGDVQAVGLGFEGRLEPVADPRGRGATRP